MAVDLKLSSFTAIDDHIDNIVQFIKTLVPRNITVTEHIGRFDNHKSFDVYLKKLPCILISLAKTRVMATRTLEDVRQMDIQLIITLNVIAKDMPALPRQTAVQRIVQLLSWYLPQQSFNTQCAALSSGVEFRNLHSAALEEKLNIALWGGMFTQLLELKTSAEPAAIPADLLYSEVPEIGTDHKDDYQPLTDC